MTKKKIRKNATVKIAKILKQAKTAEYFCKDNDYKGGLFKKLSDLDIRFMVDDVFYGQAVMYEHDDGSHTLYYARPMRIVLTN